MSKQLVKKMPTLQSEKPIVLACSVVKVTPSVEGFAAATFKIQGDKVLSVELSELGSKALAQEHFKKKTVHHIFREEQIYE